MIDTLKFLLLLTIFIIPLVPNYFGFGYESAKVLVFIILNIISGLVFVYLLGKKKLKIHWTKIKVASLAFLLLFAFSSVFGISPFDSLMGRYPYYQGLILYWFLFLFFLIVSEVGLSFKLLSKAISFSALFVSLVAIYQFSLINLLKIDIPTYAGRVVSTFGQPNFYSGFLVFSLPFIYYLIIKSHRLFNIYSLIFLANLIGILFSFSRIAIFLTLVVVVVKVLKFMPKISQTLLISLIILIVSIWSFLSFDNTSGLIYKEIIEPQTNLWLLNNSPEKRVLIWPIILELIYQKPLLGYGLENLSPAFSGYLARFDPIGTPLRPAIFALKNLVLDRSHNYLLDLLVFSGVLGLLSFSILMILIFKKARRNETLLAALIIYLIWIQFQNQSIVHLMFFWIIAGIVDKEKKLSDDGF